MLRACCTPFLAVVLESTTVRQVKMYHPLPQQRRFAPCGLYMLQNVFILKGSRIASIVSSLPHSEVPPKVLTKTVVEAHVPTRSTVLHFNLGNVSPASLHRRDCHRHLLLQPFACTTSVPAYSNRLRCIRQHLLL